MGDNWIADIRRRTAILFFYLMRTHLEYAVSVWGPHDSTQMDQLEAVQPLQQGATKMVPHIRGRPDPERPASDVGIRGPG